MSTVITCPLWCEWEHREGDQFGEDNDIHFKYFGNPKGAHVDVWVTMYANGAIKSSGIDFEIDEASDPEDLEKVAGWCVAAAAFMREIRGVLVTA